MKIKTKKTNWPRLCIQGIVFLIVLTLALIPGIFNTPPDFEAYCPFGGLQALGSYFISNSLSCTMTSAQIIMGIILLLGVILFSKLFCSYICPIGTVSEWLGKLGEKIKMRITIKGIADKILRSLKYILLFATVYFTFQSNELFCKKFDPYFASTTGFSSDVVVLYAAIAIAVVVFGSVFIRLFWCKYLCPLGALSNIFKFTILFAATLGIYLILVFAGVEISYVWPLAIGCAGGYTIELLGQKSRIFPVAKITRNTATCIDCKLCSKKCPQAIDVASLQAVKHADCNLCGDCLHVCPVENTLTINKSKKLKWLPAVAVVLLVATGLILGSRVEIPTIDQKWFEPNEMANYQVYELSGLKSVKCYGSSMTFANKMKQVDGVYGVATFVKQHRVKVYYNPDKLTPEKLKEDIFTPQKKVIAPLKKNIETVAVATVKLDKFFDAFDFSYLSILLGQQTDAVGLVTEYGCPVIVKLYFPNEVKDLGKLVSVLESKTLTYETTAGKTTVKLGYKVVGKPEISNIDKKSYVTAMFKPFESSFNDREKYSDDVVKTLSLKLGKNAEFASRYNYLISHLSNDLGIVAFNTRLDSLGQEECNILYVDTLTTPKKITTSMQADSLSVTFTNGTIKKVKNMFDFKNE
jgi:polyferredoxin